MLNDQGVSKMLSRRAITPQTLRTIVFAGRRTGFVQRRCISQADIDDPDMNGGYINPPRVKRQFRDPYGDWWDKQERRNYGEPVHEDNDILGMFSLEEYTHTTPRIALLQIGCFVGAVLGLCGIVSMYYPDTPTVPREFEGDLEKELGGPGTVSARAPKIE